MSGIRFADRTLILGYTGSGKSELLNHQLSAFRCQRLLLDTKDEWRIRGVEPVASAESIDWRLPMIHVCPPTDRHEIDRVFEAAFRRRNLVVAVHELADLCEYEPSRTPRGVREYLSKGRSHGLGLLGASQRPVEMPKRARTEVQHVFVVVPRTDQDDVETTAKILRTPAAELADQLDDVHQELGDYAFLWFDRQTQELKRCPPLPAQLRKASLIRRRRRS